MQNLFLTIPNEKYQKSFENYVQAYRKINDTYYFTKYKKALEDFQAYLDDIANYANGNNLAHGQVRTSTFWLIHNAEVVGVVRIRHQEVESAGHIGYDISPDCRNQGYGNRILKLALEEVAKIGMEEVVLTCYIDNVASKKIIENHGGKLSSIIYDEEEDEYLYRYIISLK